MGQSCLTLWLERKYILDKSWQGSVTLGSALKLTFSRIQPELVHGRRGQRHLPLLQAPSPNPLTLLPESLATARLS